MSAEQWGYWIAVIALPFATAAAVVGTTHLLTRQAAPETRRQRLRLAWVGAGALASILVLAAVVQRAAAPPHASLVDDFYDGLNWACRDYCGGLEQPAERCDDACACVDDELRAGISNDDIRALAPALPEGRTDHAAIMKVVRPDMRAAIQDVFRGCEVPGAPE